MSLIIGKTGEKIAESYLRRKGYRILQKDFRSRLSFYDEEENRVLC